MEIRAPQGMPLTLAMLVAMVAMPVVMASN